MSYVPFIVCDTLISNILVNLVQQVVGIPMRIDSAFIVANVILYAIEIQFIYTLYRIIDK